MALSTAQMRKTKKTAWVSSSALVFQDRSLQGLWRAALAVGLSRAGLGWSGRRDGTWPSPLPHCSSNLRGGLPGDALCRRLPVLSPG
jgi:hypothetical protein